MSARRTGRCTFREEMERVRERELESEINKRSIWSRVLDESNICSYFYFFAKKTTASLASSLALRRTSFPKHTNTSFTKSRRTHQKKRSRDFACPTRRDARKRKRERGSERRHDPLRPSLLQAG